MPTRTLSVSPDLSLPLEAVTQTFGILAKRGAGKTYCALVLVEELLGAGLRTVVVDPIGVAWGLRASADGKRPGLPIVVLGGDHGDAPLEATAGELIASFVVEERPSLVLDLSLLRKGEQVRFMTDFCERLYHKNREPLHLVLDEADAWAPQRPMRGTERLLGAVEDLVRRGRARGIGVSLVTQRAAVLNKNVLTQIEVLVALRTIAPQDRAAIDAWIEVHGTPEQRETLMASLPSLPIGTAWFWSPGWLDLFQRIRVRRRETFDSSATPKVGARRAEPRHLADIDLAALRTRMAATIEQAKANDPRELRRRIATLERELVAAQGAARSAAALQPRAVAPALSAADRRRLTTVTLGLTRTVQALDPRLQQAEALSAKLDAIRTDLTRGASDLRAAAASLEQALQLGPRPAPGPAWSPQGGRVEARRSPAPSDPPRVNPGPPARRRAASAVTPLEGDASVTGPEQRILDALAWCESIGVTEPAQPAVAFLAGYTYGAGAYNNPRGRLRTRGWVEYLPGDRLRLTDDGRAHAQQPSAPLSVQELHARVLARLPTPAQRILTPLIRAYPNSVPDDELAAAAGYTAGAGAFNNPKGRLRTLGLIEYPAPRTARATPLLFLEAS